MLDYGAVNWVAVIVAAVVQIVIGTIWYLPALFGRRWAMELGRDLGARPDPMLYGVAIVGALITSYVMALLVHATGVASITEGLVLGGLVGAGILAANQAVGGSFEGRSWALWGINAGNSVVSLAVVGAILAAMG
ncbi:MAG: DUF1761 domain-containing protein [Chloroflexota bacterium]